MTKEENATRRLTSWLGIVLTLLVACTIPVSTISPMPVATTMSTTTPLLVISPGLTPTLTEEQRIIAAAGARFGSGFFSSRADCVQAVNTGAAEQCVFPTGIESITKPEWRQLFPDTVFYLVDISSWRSSEGLLAHETQDGGTSRCVVAWQDGQAYYSETFDSLLEANAIAITDTNRESVARSFAFMSIPEYLGGDVRFFEWKAIEPGTYRHNYSHCLQAWTEIWGCEVFWCFVFTDQQISIVSRGGSSCHVSKYSDYIEDTKYFAFDCEHVPLGVPPYFKDYYFNR